MTDTTAPQAPSTGVDARPAFNVEWLTRMRTEKPAFLNRLLDVFSQDEPTRMKALACAVDTRDLKQVAYLAHSLKGAAATMAMERLRDACRGLEFATKGEGDLDAWLAAVLREADLVFAAIRDNMP